MQNVLIVDDHPSLRRGIGQLLIELGWNVIGECGTYKEATLLMRTEPWTVAILDLNLPDGDGIALLEEARAMGFNQPILVHSMLSDSQVAARVFKAGGNGFLNKMSQPEELQVAAKKVAEGGRYVSPQFAEEMALNLSSGRSQNLHEDLSPQEYKMLVLTGQGKSSAQIAEALGCSVNTLSSYRRRILSKLKLKTTMDMMRYAINNRLVNMQ